MRVQIVRSMALAIFVLSAGAWLLAPPRARAAETPPYDQKKNVVYGEVDGVALLMDIFTPTGKKNGIGIVDVASGYWHSDRGKIEDHRRARFYDIFCARGYTVFAIRPGSVTKFTAAEMVKNLRTGTHWVRDHAGEFGIDPERLGLTGASAGGHLACLTVVSTESASDGKIDQPFKAVAVFFPPTDFLAWGDFTLDFSKDDQFSRAVRGLAIPRSEQSKKPSKEQLRSMSPTRLIQGKQPPFLILHGDADVMVPLQQSQVFIEALKKTGTSTEFIVKKGGGHPWPTIAEEVKIVADWFDKQFEAKP